MGVFFAWTVSLVIAIIAYAVGFLMFEQSTRTEILGPLTLSAEEQTVPVTPLMRCHEVIIDLRPPLLTDGLIF